MQDNPIGWATAKQGLGNALEELGHNNSDSSSLNQAIDAYNDSLKVFKSDREPLQWATVKYEQGEALEYLGELGSGIQFSSKRYRPTARRWRHCRRTGRRKCAKTFRKVSTMRSRTCISAVGIAADH